MRVLPCTHRPRATSLKLQYFRASGTGILQLKLSLFQRPCSNVGGITDDLKDARGYFLLENFSTSCYSQFKI